MGKHYGHIIIEAVLSLKTEGLTHREIGQQLGYSQKQIKKLVEKYNLKQRKIAAGIAPNHDHPSNGWYAQGL